MYAYGSCSSLDEAARSTPPTRLVQPLVRDVGAVAIPQRAHQSSPSRQQSAAPLSMSAPVSIPAHRVTYNFSPLQHTAEPPGRHLKASVSQDCHGGRSWSPTVRRGRRISTGSVGGSQSPCRPTSDDDELSRRADRAQQRRRIAPQSRFNRQRFDVDRAPSLDSKSARKTSWMREAALEALPASSGGGGLSGPQTAAGTSSGPSVTCTAHMHAPPKQPSARTHPDVSQMTSKQRKKLLQRERRAARAAQAGFDPVAIADDLLLFAESSCNCLLYTSDAADE